MVFKGDSAARGLGLAGPVVGGGGRDPALNEAIRGGRAVHLDAKHSHLSDPRDGQAAPLTVQGWGTGAQGR